MKYYALNSSLIILLFVSINELVGQSERNAPPMFVQQLKKNHAFDTFLAVDSLLENENLLLSLPEGEQLSLYHLFFESILSLTEENASVQQSLMNMETDKLERVLEIVAKKTTPEFINQAIFCLEIQRTQLARDFFTASPNDRRRHLWQTTRKQLKAEYLAASDSIEKKKLLTEIREVEQKIRDLNTLSDKGKEGLSASIPPTLSQVQNHLNSNEACLSYYVGDSMIYALVIKSNSSHIIGLSPPGLVKQQVENFQRNIHPFLKKEPFTQANYAIYNMLFQPLEGILKGIQNIHLIPDQFLGAIPFENLTSTNPSANNWTRNYRDLDYLIERFRFTYIQSLGSWIFFRNQPFYEKPFPRILAMAPGYLPDMKKVLHQDSLAHQLASIPKTLELVSKLAKIFPEGSYYTKEAATSEELLNNWQSHGIIQLLAHTIVEESDLLSSSIAMAPDRNNPNQLDYLSFRKLLLQTDTLVAQLVILSSCDTGNGNILEGESISGLARDFGLFGVPGLVYSFWSVDETATCLLLDEFYGQIQQGVDAASALRRAKLVLMNFEDGKYSAPYFWSGFAFYGYAPTFEAKATNPISYYPYFGFIGGLILLIIGLVLKRKKAAIQSTQ